jgi:hypothetical protein
MIKEETNDTEILLFKNISRNLLLYGFANVSYQVEFLSKDNLHKNEDVASINYFLSNLNIAIEKHGKLFMHHFLNKHRRKKYANKEINHDHVIVCKEIVCKNYGVNIDDFLKKDRRDGKTIFATSALTTLLIDVLSYSRKDIMELLNKSNVFISNRKKNIEKLDYNHRYDRSILDKYLKSKVELINYILNGKEQRN